MALQGKFSNNQDWIGSTVYFITNLSLADINSAQPSHPIKKGLSFQRNCGAVLEGEYNRQGN